MPGPEQAQDQEQEKDRVERRKQGDRRVATTDRRNADRVVTDTKPRRQNPDRRRNRDS